MIDGGFSRGTDMVKAIALGADAVAMGRMYCYGLAAARRGRRRARCWRFWSTEIAVAMALLGATAWLSWIGRICISARRW